MKYVTLILMVLLFSGCNGEEVESVKQPTKQPVKEDVKIEVSYSFDKEVQPMKESGFDYGFEADGKEYKTFISNRFGTNDIWLAWSTDGKSYNALFTGCTLRFEAWSEAYTAAYKDGKIVISYEKAINRGQDEAHTRFVASLAEIERDSDSDGLTDLVEYRFGTDANEPDTDKDGIKDGEDGNPLAAANDNLREEQEVWKVAFEQHRDKLEYLARDELLIAVFDSETDYLELSTWPMPVLSSTEDDLERYRTDIGFGTRCVFFKEITYSKSIDGNRTATFEIQEFYMPLQARGIKITLEKRDGKWIIVKSEIEWQA